MPVLVPSVVLARAKIVEAASGVWTTEPGRVLEECRLAGAVRSDEADHLAGGTAYSMVSATGRPARLTSLVPMAMSGQTG